jgi:hypothetical protein
MRGTPRVLEVGLFLIISAELRAIQLARGRAPCIEMLLERLPTVGATADSSLDRQVADHNHHASPYGAKQRKCGNCTGPKICRVRLGWPFVIGPNLMKVLAAQRGEIC